MNADLRPILVSLVPRGWSAVQALRAVQLLHQAIAAIWFVHGEAMGKAALGEAATHRDEPVASGPTGAAYPTRSTGKPAWDGHGRGRQYGT